MTARVISAAKERRLEEAERPGARRARHSAWPALPVLLLALALRLYHLDYQSFWGDEEFALRIARESFNQLIPALARSEPHPPLYYASLHLWRDIAGESDFALRLLSTLFSVIAVAAVYGLGRQLGGRRVAVSAAFLTAVNPFQIWYAQETRMYAMLVGLTAWSVLLFYTALASGGRRRWIAYTVVTAFAIYSHYHGLFALLFENVIAALWWWRTRRLGRAWLASQITLVMIFLPWVYIAQHIFRSWSGWMPPADFATMLSRSFSAHTLGTSFPADWSVQATIALGVWTVLALGILLLRRPALGTFLALYALVPLGGAYLLGEILSRSMFNERYLIVISPAFYLLVGYGVGWRGWRMPISLFGVLLATAFSIVSLNNHYFDWHYQKDDLRGMAAYIDAHAEKGDLVVASITRQWGYERYTKAALPSYLIPPEDGPSQVGADLSKAVAGSGYRRLWYLPYARSEIDIAGDRWLAEHAYPAEVRWFNTARVVLAGLASAGPPTAQNLDFGGRVRLVGYSIAGMSFVPGDVVGLSIYWQSEKPGDADLKISLRLLDAHGNVYVQTDPTVGQGFHPPRSWAPGETVRDNYGVLLPVDIPPGRYHVELQLYDGTTGREIAPLDQHGSPLGSDFALPEVEIKSPSRPPSIAALEVSRPISASFGTEARLVGDELPKGVWQAGARVTLTLNWLGLQPNGQQYRPVLRLIDANGKEAAKHIATATALPTDRWRPGELVRDIHDWRLPPGLPAGTYSVQLSLESAEGVELPVSGGGSRFALDHITLSARPNYTPPAPPEHATDYKLGPFAKLAGYDLSATTLRPGDTLRLTLHWQALDETEESYKVFTHLLSADERIVAQEDNIPCAGQCPTSGWAAGEALADGYKLTLPPNTPAGTYQIEVGMYQPVGGHRLAVTNATGQPIGDRIVLGEVSVP